MKYLTLLAAGALMALVTTLPLRAQDDAPSQNPFTEIDRISISTPESVEKSAKHLAQYLLQYAHTDAEKARAVCRWITHNIAYDAEAYFTGQLRSTNIDPDDVFRNRLTICDGYARLFKEITSLMDT